MEKVSHRDARAADQVAAAELLLEDNRQPRATGPAQWLLKNKDCRVRLPLLRVNAPAGLGLAVKRRGDRVARLIVVGECGGDGEGGGWAARRSRDRQFEFRQMAVAIVVSSR